MTKYPQYQYHPTSDKMTGRNCLFVSCNAAACAGSVMVSKSPESRVEKSRHTIQSLPVTCTRRPGCFLHHCDEDRHRRGPGASKRPSRSLSSRIDRIRAVTKRWMVVVTTIPGDRFRHPALTFQAASAWQLDRHCSIDLVFLQPA